MKIGILGTGVVGQALGRGFATLGCQVKMGSRQAGNAKAQAWASDVGPNASEGSFADAVAFGDIIVLATLGTANEDAIRAAGIDRFDGKVVIDTTNPLDFSTGAPKLAVGHTDSGGERVQRLLPRAHVVKAFNTVGNAHMFRPSFADGPPDMFICGDSDDAKAKVSAILHDFGWGIVDVGGIEASRYLEPMCMTWVMYGIRTGTWNHAFKLLRS